VELPQRQLELPGKVKPKGPAKPKTTAAESLYTSAISSGKDIPKEFMDLAS
jgi:hypothetical protein